MDDSGKFGSNNDRTTGWGPVRWQFFVYYILALAIACFLSFTHYNWQHAKHESPTISQELTAFWEAVLTPFGPEHLKITSQKSDFAVVARFTAVTPAQVAEAYAKEIDTRLDTMGATLEKRLHAPQEPGEVILKVALVISISITWFLAFIIPNTLEILWKHHLPGAEYLRFRALSERASNTSSDLRRKALIYSRRLLVWMVRKSPTYVRRVLVFFALLPALLFVLSMRDAYEPSVFVLALVAIFVAAEHFGGLREAEHHLIEKTDEITGKIGTVLNADGLAEWRAEVYKLYATATKRIDAVVRHFDMDQDWWLCAGNSQPWEAYETLCGSNPEALLSVLKTCKAKVQFVAELPMPPFTDQSGGGQQRAEYFRKLLGLAWHLVVFEKVRRYRKNLSGAGKQLPSKAYLRIKISRAPSWVHVVDETVYQVVERGLPENSTVRRLTSPHNEAEGDEEVNFALSDWARRSVRQFAYRGTLAEEYVCSVLRYQALLQDYPEDEALNKKTLTKMLNGLGMQDFLEQPNAEFVIPSTSPPRATQADHQRKCLVLEQHAARELCVGVFDELLSCRMHPDVCALPIPVSKAQVTVRHLSYEVL